MAAAGGRHNIHEQFDNIVLIGNVIKNVPPAKIRSLVVREPSKLVEGLLSSVLSPTSPADWLTVAQLFANVIWLFDERNDGIIIFPVST